MKQLPRAMRLVRFLFAFTALLFAMGARAQAPLPGIFQFTTAQFPGTNGFSAVRCLVDSTSLYVGIGNNSGPPYSSEIVRLALGTMQVQAVIPMPAGAWLNDLAFSPGKIWGSDAYNGDLYRVDLGSNMVDLTVPTGSTSVHGLSYGLGNMLASLTSNGTAQFFDAVTGNAVGAPIVMGPSPFYSAFDPDNGKFWVALYGAGETVKIDGTTLLATNTFLSGPNPFSTTIDSSYVYVTSVDGTITVFNKVTNAVVATWHLPAGAGAHFAARIGSNLWVAQDANNTIGVLNATTGANVNTIPVGKDPPAVCYDAAHNVAYSIDYETGFAPLTGWTVRTNNP
jgi:YVTN family beta-propeller protein